MILSTIDIRNAMQSKDITIFPFIEKYLGDSSYDIHLARTLLVMENEKPIKYDLMSRENSMKYILKPGEFLLGCSLEFVGVPTGRLEGRIDGTSSIGREAMTTHITASKLNPGHSLHLTMEIVNLSNKPIELKFGMPIGQVTFEELKTPIDFDYLKDKLLRSYGGVEFDENPIPETSKLKIKTAESHAFFLDFFKNN